MNNLSDWEWVFLLLLFYAAIIGLVFLILGLIAIARIRKEKRGFTTDRDKDQSDRW